MPPRRNRTPAPPTRTDLPRNADQFAEVVMDNNVTSVLQTLIPHPSTLPSSIRPALTTARQSILYALSDTRQFVTGTKVDFELAETQSRSADFNRIRAAIDTANMRSRFR